MTRCRLAGNFRFRRQGQGKRVEKVCIEGGSFTRSLHVFKVEAQNRERFRVGHLGIVQHCLNEVTRVWSFTYSILVTLNVNDEDNDNLSCEFVSDYEKCIDGYLLLISQCNSEKYMIFA